jgi:glycosyltransferase involved in cell wall biosynthesis
VAGTLGYLAVLMFSSFVWDVKHIRFQKTKRKSPNSRALKSRPAVSVVIISEFSNANLSHCIRSVIRNSYRKYEILVVSSKEETYTKTVVQKFKDKYPKKIIKLIQLGPYDRKAQIERFCKGEYVLIINSNCLINRRSLHIAMSYFALNKSIRTVTLGMAVSHSYTLTNLRQHFELALIDQKQKINNLLGLSPREIGTIYKRGSLSSNKNIRWSYAGGAMIEIGGEFSLIKNNYASLPTFGVTAAITYFLYLAFFHQYFALLAYAWSYYVFLILFCILTCGQINTGRKTKLILLSPMASQMLYFLSIGKMFNYYRRREALEAP